MSKTIKYTISKDHIQYMVDNLRIDGVKGHQFSTFCRTFPEVKVIDMIDFLEEYTDIIIHDDSSIEFVPKE